jgi:hypothetical protein
VYINGVTTHSALFLVPVGLNGRTTAKAAQQLDGETPQTNPRTREVRREKGIYKESDAVVVVVVGGG